MRDVSKWLSTLDDALGAGDEIGELPVAERGQHVANQPVHLLSCGVRPHALTLALGARAHGQRCRLALAEASQDVELMKQ